MPSLPASAYLQVSRSAHQCPPAFAADAPTSEIRICIVLPNLAMVPATLQVLSNLDVVATGELSPTDRLVLDAYTKRTAERV